MQGVHDRDGGYRSGALMGLARIALNDG